MQMTSLLWPLIQKLQNVVSPVIEWAARKKLSIAPAKSQVTLFIPFNKQFNTCPVILINDVPVPLNKNPKILGITFGMMFCFYKHIAEILAKALQRLNLTLLRFWLRPCNASTS
jgi:5-methylcytosine-specific restriction endonuclease McrBC regulatory subunit McrC